MRHKPEYKLYVVRKFIEANSLKEAIKKEKNIPLDEIWVDDDWKKAQGMKTNVIGYHVIKKNKNY